MQRSDLARAPSIEQGMGRVKACLRKYLDAMQWGAWIIPKGLCLLSRWIGQARPGCGLSGGAV
jgi:hypothetical protein